MKPIFPRPLAAFSLAGLASLAQPALAQDVFTSGVTVLDNNTSLADLHVLDDATINGSLCIGYDCGSAEIYGGEALKLSNTSPRVLFNDSSASGTTRDWSLQTNDSGFEFFLIYDHGASTFPFIIDGGAPSRALAINSDGNVGIGGSASGSRLTINSGDTPSLRFEQDGSGGNAPQEWAILANETNWYVRDRTNNTGPFYIYPGPGNEGALTIGGDGRIGMGTYEPSAQLHVTGDQGTAQLKIEETIGAQTARPLLNMVNYGRPDIIMANTATGGEWAFGAGTNFVLKTGAVGSSDGDKTRHLRLYGATGNLEITGQIITGGPTCSGGCDAVFSEDYDLPSISEHAAEMFALGHLPNVGPTAPNQPVNMSEQYGKLLNELEHAHIYIAEQDGRLSEQARQISDQNARIARLEALLLDKAD